MLQMGVFHIDASTGGQIMQVLKYCRLLAILSVVAICSRNACGSGQTVYVAQSAGTFSGGSACNGQTAESVATFNAGSESAGNIYVLCGTITTPLKLNGSGTSGNVITMKWDTGARISQPVAQGINLNGATAYWLFDGGVACGPGTECDVVEAANQTGYATGQTGIIEATANGSALANRSATSQAFYGCSGCHDIEIKNLIMRNLYVHSSMSDNTSNIDAGAFAFQCYGGTSGCVSGTIAIHDSVIHDTGNAISLEKMSGTSIYLYNLDMFHNNWEVENSGNGTRTLYIYGNHWHDASNWDTSGDVFHHNGIHNYMNVSSDSLGLYLYNNLADGDWGACCTTSNLTFVEVEHPAYYYVFNNVVVQSCSNNTAPADSSYTTPSGQGEIWYNNTLLGCRTTASNTRSVDLYGTGMAWENNAVEGYGQYVVVGTGYSFSALDYNVYGAIGTSGNLPWQCGSTGNGSFAVWQSSCGGDAHGQKVTLLNVSTSTGKPNPGSPLIGAGFNLHSECSGQPNPGLGALCYDAAGTARPSSGAWSAGAYSSGAGPNPPTNLTGTTVP